MERSGGVEHQKKKTAGGVEHQKKKITGGVKHQEKNIMAVVDEEALGKDEDNRFVKSIDNVPFFSQFNDHIRHLLDAVDRLRELNVSKEGIKLPTIVVVGDQSSGKSSVLESLAGISLPRGQGICTRVPLIMRLQGSHYYSSEPQLHLEYQGKTVQTSEEEVSIAINAATEEIAGKQKGVSDNPITLVVKKKSVPDLTMVDLPGITRVPVLGQPEDIYEQISKIIMEYITPKETIILNVLSATVDFPTCESIRMSQAVDKSGERTLAVVTKSDKAPEGLLEKVTADDVNIGLGYVCVRNRIGDESYEEAREEEASLFDLHPLLSMIDKSMVGIPVLAERLVKIQSIIIGKCFPETIKNIDAKLAQSLQQLRSLPRKLNNLTEAMTAFVQIVGSAKDSLSKLLLRGEFDEYPDDASMYCPARMAEKLNAYSEELGRRSSSAEEFSDNRRFLMDEIAVLRNNAKIGLPNFFPRSTFTTLLRRKLNEVSGIPLDFVHTIWNYLEGVVVRVLTARSENYPQLLSSFRRAADSLVSKMREESLAFVREMVDMEKNADYTSNPEYINTWTNLMTQMQTLKGVLSGNNAETKIEIRPFGQVEVGHLRLFGAEVDEAFDIKMRITAYWKIVILRLVDSLALYLQTSLSNLLYKEMEEVIVKEFVGSGNGSLERLLFESPDVARKRARLNDSVKLLKESKLVLSNAMDRIENAVENDS
ncbi:hypothetical protein Syun_000458 [Stephania yunnanensis]|uniref:Dynamin-related protein 4C-like n=1 Tax=Stephania yunnanensis TaxID=152371 RepID=A0AAP0LD80_9MAGN